MNSKAKGEISEAVIMAHLIKLGDIVLLPFGNNQRYDIVIERNGNFIRGQCKTAHYRKGCLEFNVCSMNGFTGKTYDYKDQIDVFWIYYPVNEKVYEISINDVGISKVRLRLEPSKRYDKSSKIRWAKDYEI